MVVGVMEVCLLDGDGVVVEGSAVGERRLQINQTKRSNFGQYDDKDELLQTAVFASGHLNGHHSSVIDCLNNTYEDSG